VPRDASENFTTFSLHCAHRVQFLRIPDPFLGAAKRGKRTNYNIIGPALIESSLWIFGPGAVQPLVRPRPLLIIKSTRLGGESSKVQFPFHFQERLYEKQPDHLRNSEMIYRRDFSRTSGGVISLFPLVRLEYTCSCYSRNVRATFTFLPVVVFATQELRISAHK
jgi:hypothetical protein